MRVLSLCSGVGGIEIGVSLVENCHPVAFVERNEYCKSVLAKRWPGIPILDCISKVENIDCDLLTAGFPCQPWSSAGKKRGKEDERWIWPTIANIIRANRPGAVLLENVVGLISGGGLAHVLWDLANLGYDAEWSVFSCSQLGATHHRKRIFILGYDKEKFALHWAKSRSNDALGGGVSFGTRAVDKRKNFLADSNDEQRESRRDVRNGNEREHSGTSGESCEISSTISTGLLADSNDGQQPPLRIRHGNGGEPAATSGEGFGSTTPISKGLLSDSIDGQFEVSRAKGSVNGSSGRKTFWPPPPNPIEWIGVEPCAAEHRVPRMADGIPVALERRIYRARVHALGNAVSPPVAAVAWATLKARALKNIR